MNGPQLWADFAVFVLLLLFGLAGLDWIADLLERARRGPWAGLPEPDDPRLRNYLAERHWRAKRELLKRRWTT